MSSGENLLIFGASTRAAAFSALRAGLRPWCADLFGDADLRPCCPVRVLPPGSYPLGFIQAAREGPPGPWMYTGGLENRRSVVRQISALRPLWGNPAEVLRRSRSPRTLQGACRDAGISCPAIVWPDRQLAEGGRWLVKPWAGAGGSGIRFWSGGALPAGKKRVYLQEYVEGEAHAALYVGDGRRAQLLGVTRQLVGETWLHARPFAYGGSIGPLPMPAGLRDDLERLGNALARRSGLRGLFGVDFILKEGAAWPVEVNPRYTASVEVLEFGLGIAALTLHRQPFPSEPSRPGGVSTPIGQTSGGICPPPAEPVGYFGKAILFARTGIVFPGDGPWTSTLESLRSLAAEQAGEQPPAFADIPSAGQRIEAGRPVLTLFARAGSVAGCWEELGKIASDLDRRLEKT